jgi:YesN/AraC family two-component response regulator
MVNQYSKYITDYRFNEAKTLLNTTDLPVIQISNKVGYTNSNYFYTALKSLMVFLLHNTEI